MFFGALLRRYYSRDISTSSAIEMYNDIALYKFPISIYLSIYLVPVSADHSELAVGPSLDFPWSSVHGERLRLPTRDDVRLPPQLLGSTVLDGRKVEHASTPVELDPLAFCRSSTVWYQSNPLVSDIRTLDGVPPPRRYVVVYPEGPVSH